MAEIGVQTTANKNNLTIIWVFSDGTQRIDRNVREDAPAACVGMAKFWNAHPPVGQPTVTEIRVVFGEVQNDGE